MKLHLPTSLRAAVFACFAAVTTLSTTLFTAASVGGVFLLAHPGYGAYNAATATFEGTSNRGIDIEESTYADVDLLIFNMGVAGDGNYFNQASWTYGGDIQIGADGATTTGLCINNGFSDKTNIFSGRVTGSGLFSKTGAGTRLQIAFEGDVTQYTGAIQLGSTALFSLRFGGGGAAADGADAEHGVSGTGDISFIGTDKDTLLYHYAAGSPVYITNRITTSAAATSHAELRGGADYVLTKDVKLSQLTLADNTALYIGREGMRSETVLGALTMGAGATVHVDNGTLEVAGAAALEGSYVVGAQGVLRLSRLTAVQGTLSVSEGGALDIVDLSSYSISSGAAILPADGENGFAFMDGTLTLLSGDAALLKSLEGTRVLYENQELTLGANGSVAIASADHSVYYLRKGEMTLSALLAESGNRLQRVEMDADTTLRVDVGDVRGNISCGEKKSLSVSSFLPSEEGLPQRITLPSKTTMRIVSTAEGGAPDLNLHADSHLLFDAESPTVMSVGRILNTAGSSDDFHRTIHIGDSVTLRAASVLNSWGLESLTVDGVMDVSGELVFTTGSSRVGNNVNTNILTGQGRITAGSLTFGNMSSYNTISVRELIVSGNAALGRPVTISSGTTEIRGNTTVSGTLNLTGGHLILGDAGSDTSALNGNINLAAGSLTLNGSATAAGTLTQTGGTLTINGELTMSRSVTASGSVYLNGTLKADNSSLSLCDVVSYSKGDNGFRTASYLLFAQGENELDFFCAPGAAVLVNGVDITAAVRTDASGNIVFNASDRDVYYLNTGRECLSAILSEEETPQQISLRQGAVLVADSGAVHGQMSVDNEVLLTLSAEGLPTVYTGAVHMEQLSATQHLTVGNGATLSIGSTAAAGARNIDILANGHLVLASDVPTERRLAAITAAGAGATVRVKNADLRHGDAALTFNNGTMLEVEGVNTISAAAVDMSAGSTLAFVVENTPAEEAMLTLNGTLTTDTLTLSVSLPEDRSQMSNAVTLVRLGSADAYDVSQWTEDKVQVTGVSFADLTWEDGCLTLRVPTLEWGVSPNAASVTLRLHGTAAITSEESLSTWVNSSKDLIVQGQAAEPAALSVSPVIHAKSLTVENAAVHLGRNRHDIGSLTIAHGSVTIGSGNGGEGFIRGTVNIGAGGTLSLEQFDALGWGGSATALICLQGEPENEAVLELGARQTFSTNIEMGGNSRLAVSEHPTGSGGNRPGLDTYGGAIKASGTGNRIEVTLLQRDNLRLNVEASGELEIAGAVVESASGRYGSFIREGAGTLLINTPADTTITSFKQQGGTTVLGGENITIRDYTQTQGCMQVNGHATFRGSNSLQGGHLEVGENHTLSLYGTTVAAPGTISLNRGTLELAGVLLLEGTQTVTGTLTFSAGGSLQFSSIGLESYGEQVLSEGVNGFMQTSYYLLKRGEGDLVLEGASDGSILLDGMSLAGLAVQNTDGDLVAEQVRTRVYYAHEGEVRYDREMQEAGLSTLVLTHADLVLTQNLAEGVSLRLLNEGERHHVILGRSVTLDAASLCGEGLLLLSGEGTFRVTDAAYLPTTAQYADWSGLTSVSVGIAATDDIDMVGIGGLSFDTAGRSSALVTGGYNAQLCDNGDIAFTANSSQYGGAIYHKMASMELSRNNHVSFIGNRASYGGGALYNYNVADLALSGNKSLVFADNSANGSGASGGAIYNYYASDLAIADNGQVAFRNNSASYGGAIADSYYSSLCISGNREVIFSGNSAIYGGGAIFGRVSYIYLIDNGNVLFEKNAEIYDDTVRLRSLYTTGTEVSLSAAPGGNITFRDSVYLSSSVFLNCECAEGSTCMGEHGSITLTGATTEADLREMKGGIDGTEDEVNRSRFSQMVANVSLGSGALEVRDKAVLKLLGLTIGSEAHAATLRLHDAWLDSSDHVVLETGSGWELSGKNHLVSSAVVASGQNTITLRPTGETAEAPLLTVTGDLLRGELLTINVETDGPLHRENILLIHHSLATEGWESARLQVNGADSDALVWVDGDLYLNYNASHASPPLRTVTFLSGQETVVGSSMVWETGRSLEFGSKATVINDNSSFIVMDYEEVNFCVGHFNSDADEVWREDGGAIWNVDEASATLSGIKLLRFGGNQVSGKGGAIYSAATMALTDNECVVFDGNLAQLYGGAIHNVGTLYTFLINGNDEVSFLHNSVVNHSGDESVSLYGGAINNDGYFTIHGNKGISFIENRVSAGEGNSTDYAYAHGGALASMPDTCFSGSGGVGQFIGNTTIEFLRNTADATALSAAGAYGGASYIYVYFHPFEMKDNTSVSFCENAVRSKTTGEGGEAYAGGGALHHTGDEEFEMFGNGSLSFCGNTVESEGAVLARSLGGAIENKTLFSLCDNGDVTFSGNRVQSVSATEAIARGGAIYNGYELFEIGGNGDVLFEKNAEVENGVYRLRSVYSQSEMNLSASAGKSITFRDSLFIGGDVSMNSYVAEGQEAPTAYGSIVLTGATTEADLREVKGGTDGTAAEISCSRTSEIHGTLTLGGGRLMIADGAELRTGALEVLSGATVEIADGLLRVDSDASTTLSNCSLVWTKGGRINFGKTLILNGTVSLDVSGFETGSYTLFSADSVQGAACLNLNVSASDAERYTLAWNEFGDAMLLTVTEAVLPPAPPQEVPTIHVWDGGNSSLSHDTSVGGDTFKEGDVLVINGTSHVILSGALLPSSLEVNSDGKVKLTNNKKEADSGITGSGTVTKSGNGVLTLNAGNTYTGGTVLNAGTIKATAADSFGAGTITVYGGTLDLGSKAVGNTIILSGETTLKGDAKYTGEVSVEGDATMLAKASYKGTTIIGEGSSLTLTPKASMAGSISIEGGELAITAPKGMSLAKNATMQLNGGTVSGLLTIGAGSTLVWQDGSFAMAPVLKGGTLNLGGEGMLTLSGSKAQVQFGDKHVELPGKGVVYTEETLTVNNGTVTVSGLSGYESRIDVAGGTLKLATGKVYTDNEIVVNGIAAVVNGKTHSGDITVDGLLAKGTNIKLLNSEQRVTLNGNGTLLGTISGAGVVDINGDMDATAAKITAAHINLNSGTYTNAKGIKLAKGQTLTLGGVALNLGPKKALATVAGSTLALSGTNTLSGSLTLGGGELVFEGGSLAVDGTLTLSKAMTVSGSGTITYKTLKPFKGDIAALFNGADVELDAESGTLTINGGAEQRSRMASAPPDAAHAPKPVTNPVADAMVQADWGIIDAERAFLGAVNSRHQHAALLDKGQGAAWVSAFGASVRHGNKGAHHGSDGNIEGAAFGLEHAVSEKGSIGLAVGRSKNRIAATGVTHLRQETAHVALYGQKQLAHGFTADAAATYGDTETKLGAASWQQKSAALTARLTHAQQLTEATAFRTFGGLAYEATESGNILGAAHSGSVQNFRGELGAGITHTAGKAHLYAEAALTGDMVRHNPTADLGGFRTHGANPGRIGVRATIGGLYEFTDTWSGTASYGIEAESRSTSHTFNVGVSKTF